MSGYIEIREDSYEDTIEHLHRIKALACKLIKKMALNSELYNEDYEEESRSRRGRYSY